MPNVYFGTQTTTIAAGGSVTLPIVGNYFHCIRSTLATFEVAIDGEYGGEMEAGRGFDLPDGETYKSLHLVNTDGANPLTVTFNYGRGSYRDAKLQVSGSIETSLAGSAFPSTADVPLGATATTQILAANTSRKEVLVSNLAANPATIRVGDVNAGAGRGVEVAPGQTITVNTTAAIYAYNPGAAQNVGVVEIET